jgi:hypothetical protein
MELGLAIAIMLIVALTAGGKSSSNGGTNGGSTNGGNDGRWTPGPDGRGHVWADPADTPRLPSAQQFDYDANGLWIDPECGFVLEGDHFWPESDAFVWESVEASSLDATLAVSRTNTVIGYLDYLTGHGYSDPVEIAYMILGEAAPLCADVPAEEWGEPMRRWFTNFLDRVTHYIETGDNLPLGGT